MVLGPNGSGKSTILCAIALGLGGSPNLLGRGDDLKTFIMHEKMSAFVEVELKGKPTSKNRIVIRRQIEDIGEDKNAKSSYTLNGESITQKRVKEVSCESFSGGGGCGRFCHVGPPFFATYTALTPNPSIPSIPYPYHKDCER